jgi:hypothetical protein
MNKYAAGILTSKTASIASTSTYVWTSAILFQTAATEGIATVDAAPTSADVLNGLYQISNNNLGGLAPAALTFTRGHPASPINCWFYVELQHHTPVAPTGLTPQCIPGAPPTGRGPGVL